MNLAGSSMLKMKTTIANTCILFVLASTFMGCVAPDGRPDYTGSGALIGGASGATIGAIADRRNPGAGALIGGVAGLITGGLIGHGMDQQARAREVPPPPTYLPPPQYQPPPSLSDIESMSRTGMSDDVIINQINSTHAVYHLDTDAILSLKNAGVSQNVIAYMINTSTTVVNQAPPPPPADTVVVAPGPDYVWTGGEWVWNGATWVWLGGRWVVPPHPHAYWVEARWVRGPRGWYRVSGHWR
jgi:hypothetical protein